MNKIVTFIGFMMVCQMALAAPDTTLDITPAASSNTTIAAADENTRNNTIESSFNSHGHTDITQTGSTLNIGASSGGTSINSAGTVVLEGSTTDGNETTVSPEDPTADRTLTIPDADSVTLPTGAIFFMITGSCPNGTTDVSATYADKFIRINATAGTEAGSDTDSITLAEANLASHTHSVPSLNMTLNFDNTNSTGSALPGGGSTSNDSVVETTDSNTTGSTGSGTAFTVDTVPAYVTAVLCQVD